MVLEERGKLTFTFTSTDCRRRSWTMVVFVDNEDAASGIDQDASTFLSLRGQDQYNGLSPAHAQRPACAFFGRSESGPGG